MRRAPALVVLAWNAHLGNKHVPRGLSRLNHRRAHVIVLNEVPFRHAEIREWARDHGYVMFAEEPGDRRRDPVSEHGSTVVLVDTTRPELEVLRARVVVGRQDWRVVSHDRTHEPRRDWVLRLRLHGHPFRLFASHVPTGGIDGPNGPAVREWLDRVERALERRRDRAVVVDVGDHNNPLSFLRRHLDAAVAGRGVDSAIVAGASVRSTVLGKHGSDTHRAVRYIIRHSLTP